VLARQQARERADVSRAQLGPSVNEPLATSSEVVTPGSPPTTGLVASSETNLTPLQRSQLKQLIKARPSPPTPAAIRALLTRAPRAFSL